MSYSGPRSGSPSQQMLVVSWHRRLVALFLRGYWLSGRGLHFSEATGSAAGASISQRLLAQRQGLPFLRGYWLSGRGLHFSEADGSLFLSLVVQRQMTNFFRGWRLHFSVVGGSLTQRMVSTGFITRSWLPDSSEAVRLSEATGSSQATSFMSHHIHLALWLITYSGFIAGN